MDPTIKVRINGDSSNLEKTLDKSKAGVMSLASELKGLAGALGVGFGVSQAVSLGRSLLDAADAASDTAKGLGESLENVIALQKLAQLAGVDQEKALNWMQRMKALKEDIIDSNGTSANSKKLVDMGVDLNEIANGSLVHGIELIVKAANDAGGEVKNLNEWFGRLASVDLKDTMSRGLASVADEAKRAKDETKLLADEKERLDKLSSGFKAGAASFMAEVIETNQRVVKYDRAGRPAPTGLNAVAEGIGAGFATAGITLAKIIPPLNRWLLDGIPKLPSQNLANNPVEPAGPVVITGVKPEAWNEAENKKKAAAEFKAWSELADARMKQVTEQADRWKKLDAIDERAAGRRAEVLAAGQTAVDGITVGLPKLVGIESLGGIMGGTGGYAQSMAERMTKLATINAESRDKLKLIEENTAKATKALEGP